MRFRSFMFLPAYNCRFIDKAVLSGADAIILDLEDSVPRDKREQARRNIVEYAGRNAFKDKTTFVRINPIGEADFIDDISELVIDGIDGFMPSKITSSEDVVFIDKLLAFWERKNGIATGQIKLAPLIETTRAVENVGVIAVSSERVVALCLGGEDYLNDLKSIYTYQESALSYARARIVNAARANGLQPIDTPYVDLDDMEGFKRAASLSYKNGFAGTLIVNPRQIDTANLSYYPEEDEIKRSQKIMEAVNSNGEDAIVMMDGKMIGPPMRKKAANVMNQVYGAMGRDDGGDA